MCGGTFTMITQAMVAEPLTFPYLRYRGSNEITIKGDVFIAFLIMLMSMYLTQSPFNV